MSPHSVLPWVFAMVLALSRWPGLLPPNFSAAYAFVFCAGALLPGRIGWILPLGVMLTTDLALNLYFTLVGGWPVFTPANLGSMMLNYGAFAVILLLGR
ncbi:MAG: DUF6580 family putative transport protein, partial [Verrucomicrobiota bacterium]